MQRFIFLFLVGILYTSCTQTGKNIHETTEAYFGQKWPRLRPEIFAPGIFSLPDRLESKIAFSPDGKACYFGVVEIEDNQASYKIYYSEYINNQWTEQMEAPFAGSNPFISADGERLYFAKDGDIWMVERTLNGWSESQLLPAPFNSPSTETSFTETAGGVAYITSKRSGGVGEGYDIWRVLSLAGEPYQAENLGPVINSSSFDTAPCLAHDGSYLIFSSARNGRRGMAHLYISFNKGNGEWTPPVNMNSGGAIINNETAHHNSPSLSPDGKFLFFVRHESMLDMDLYWVSTGVIEKLKEKALLECSPQKFTDLKGDYLGQPLPGDIPVVFAPGIISVDSTIEHGAPTFSPDGNTVFWQSNLRHKEKETDIFLKTMRRVADQWTLPEDSPYGGMPAFSPDGKQLYFLPFDTEKEKGFYFVANHGGQWSDPKSLNLIARFPELKYLYGPSITNNRTLYFFAHAEGLGSMNDFGIYRSEFIDGAYAEPELLPPSINAAEGVLNWTPFIAPDESYLLFSSNRNDSQQDIFICLRQTDGTWTDAVSLGTTINTNQGERFPSVSPDGKVLFFTRWVARGNEDVMWVSAKVIDDIKSHVPAPLR